jgi:hypothetical protein
MRGYGAALAYIHLFSPLHNIKKGQRIAMYLTKDSNFANIVFVVYIYELKHIIEQQIAKHL